MNVSRASQVEAKDQNQEDGVERVKMDRKRSSGTGCIAEKVAEAVLGSKKEVECRGKQIRRTSR